MSKHLSQYPALSEQQMKRKSTIKRIGSTILTFAVVMIIVALALLAIIFAPTLLAQLDGRVKVETLQQGSIARAYRVYRPASVSAHSGLVIMLHGANLNGFLQEIGSNFDFQADRLKWIVIYPDGISDGWDAYGCCNHPGVDDVVFISNLIDHLVATDNVDPSRVYISGISRGAMMAYRLACELSSKIAAIAPVEGNMADENGSVQGVSCQPTNPVSVLVIHGDADREVPIGGGTSLVHKESISYAPLKDVVEKWRSIDKCGSEALVDVSGSRATATWSCQDGSVVAQFIISGGVHTWPGTPLGLFVGLIGSGPQTLGPESSVDGSRIIADFFAAHTLTRSHP